MFYICCYKYVLFFFNTKFNKMEELKTWVEYNIFHLKKKIDYMKEHVPEHRNIKWFEGQLVSNEKILIKIDELSKK